MKTKNSPIKRDSIVVSKNNGITLSELDGEYRVSTRLIADSLNIQHQSIVKLLSKHRIVLLEHGSWSGFKIQSSGQKIEAFLNESQAIFLMTLLRNTAYVVSFKSNLVKAYIRKRKQNRLLMVRNSKLEYLQNRELGKLHRRDLTDEIKPFIGYAKDQGSKGSHFLYMNINKWINSACGIDSIEDASETELANVSTACDIVLNTIHAGIVKEQNYKIIKVSIKSNLESFSSLLCEVA